MKISNVDIFSGFAGLGVLIGNDTTFMTSLEAIQKVMNVPMEAIASIGRTAGMEILDTSSECIDENSLAPFAEAYVRKMKCYFNNSLRSKDQLGPEELSTFIKFTHLFKKPTAKTACAESWKDIDQDALRDQFYAELRKISREKKQDGLSASHILFSDSLWSTIDYHSCTNDLKQFKIKYQANKAKVLKSVVNSRLYHTGKTGKTQKRTSTYAHNIIRIMLHSARYHLCSDDGKEEHHQDAGLIGKGYRGHFINRTLMMTA